MVRRSADASGLWPNRNRAIWPPYTVALDVSPGDFSFLSRSQFCCTGAAVIYFWKNVDGVQARSIILRPADHNLITDDIDLFLIWVTKHAAKNRLIWRRQCHTQRQFVDLK